MGKLVAKVGKGVGDLVGLVSTISLQPEVMEGEDILKLEISFFTSVVQFSLP